MPIRPSVSAVKAGSPAWVDCGGAPWPADGKPRPRAGPQVWGYLGLALPQPGVGRVGLPGLPAPAEPGFWALSPYLAVLASLPCPTSHLHPLPYKSRNVSLLSLSH